ncbi:MAG TPA: hypothetical protein VKE74_02420, partial [Gemmataceae bacterium]|nr:hypothetical protein [Gemmataceae bacterium]
MFRTALLQVSQLEEREVPSAAMFADIFPGVWGSYPLNLTPSGNTLFFSADNGHGYEPYTTDGTPGSARMLKNIKPGLGGSNPSDFYAADGGVVYLTADDGTGRALWRSDGTAAGTAKVPGFPAGDTFGGYWAPYRPQAVGLNGSLYFLTATPGSGDMRLWKTDGATTTLLHDFGSVPATVLTNVDLTGGKVTVTFIPPAWTGNTTTIWVTDGTPAGTRLQQQPLTASDPKYGSVALGTGVEVSPGLFVHPTLVSYATGNTATLWASDGVNPASVRLLAA